VIEKESFYEQQAGMCFFRVNIMSCSSKREKEKKMKKIWKFFKDEEGLELTEYAVIGALIVIGILVAITFLSTQINESFSRMGSVIQSGIAASGT
jgi:Flp pilus assembly pilin Flp